MFNASIDLLWLAAALSVLGVSGFLCYLLFHTAHLVRESRRTVEDVNGKLKRVDPAIDAVTVSLTEIQTAITSVRHNIVEPIASITSMLRSLSSLRDRFSSFFPFGGRREASSERASSRYDADVDSMDQA